MTEIQKFLIVVRAAIVKDGKVVLVRKHAERPHPLAGKWATPGGILEKGETPEACCEREALEETGLCVRVVKPLDVTIKYEQEANTPSWFVKAPIVLCGYGCEYISGRLRAGDDVDQARWFSFRDAVKTAAREYDKVALRKAFSYLGGKL
ncbi:NUDIX domain-containing protein [archaeon]|nr:NUDIX domain-containing protein [archaeon]